MGRIKIENLTPGVILSTGPTAPLYHVNVPKMLVSSDAIQFLSLNVCL